MATTATDAQLCIDTIRTLAIDAIETSNSGHPGLPLAMAPLAYLLFTEVMEHDPADPEWPDRDRFVLSAGHGSMLLYAALHLSGYDLSLDEIKRFRQWGSLTPGHPERDRIHVTPGVEVTTGPLGQGFANGVGMAMAERFLRERYGAEVMDHRVYAIVSDGDLMEGIASEAASLAGQLRLDRLVYLYDDNAITLDGPAEWTFDREDRRKRFEAYGWHVQSVDDANDVDALRAAIRAAQEEGERPSLVNVKSIIGWPSPEQGTADVHGKALGPENARITKERLGWDPDAQFVVPDGVYAAFDQRERGGALHEAWREGFERWRAQAPDLAADWDAAWAGRPLSPIGEHLPQFEVGDKTATRGAGGKAMAAFAGAVPTMVGGAADLSESTKTIFPDEQHYTAERAGRNVFWGVREHGMGGAVNGLAVHGGIVRPYGSSFLQFSDYMRGAIRLSALMALPVAWVFTHDSVALGEDGPTHQPVEHLVSLRAIPGLTVIRPADARETAEAWRVIIEELEGPALLALSRQDLPVLDGPCDVARGAYVLAPGDDAVIVATGGEVVTALEGRDQLAADGVAARVVSMPSWELFDAQDDAYRAQVLPPGTPAVSVEAGVSLGWSRYAQAHVAIDRFGASAPGTETLRQLGITADAVAAAVRTLL